MKKKKDNKKKVKYRRKELLEKVRRKGLRAFLQRRGKRKRKKRKVERVTNAPKRDKSWRSLVDCSLLVLLEQNWLCVSAAAQGLQTRTEIRRHCLKSHTKQNGKVAAAAVSKRKRAVGWRKFHKGESSQKERTG